MICLDHKLTNYEKENYYFVHYPYYLDIAAMNLGSMHVINHPVYVTGNIDFRIGERRCLICYNPTSEELCKSCALLQMDDDTAYHVRLQCNYRDHDSPLMREGWCTSDDFPCGILGNSERCHSNYYLYVGRYNNLFKVGITKSSRGKTTRAAEQGLNDAILVGGIKGLPTALVLEEFVSELLNIPLNITTEQKIQSFTSADRMPLGEYYNKLTECEELDELSIDYIQTLPDLSIKTDLSPIKIAEDECIQGNVIWIQGDLVLLDTFEVVGIKNMHGWEVQGL